MGRVPAESADEELPLLLVVVPARLSRLRRRATAAGWRPRLRRGRGRGVRIGAVAAGAGVGAPCGIDAVRGEVRHGSLEGDDKYNMELRLPLKQEASTFLYKSISS